jgi:hypothetical protein
MNSSISLDGFQSIFMVVPGFQQSLAFSISTSGMVKLTNSEDSSVLQFHALYNFSYLFFE